MKNFALLGACLALITACSSKDEKKGSAGGGAITATCREAVAQDFQREGDACIIRLVGPANCASIDLSGGKKVEFSWTTNGNCRAPYTAHIAGNPLIDNGDNTYGNKNAITLRFENSVDQNGGVVTASTADFQGLTSTDGTYDWTISSPDGSNPASRVIRVKLE